jgi:CheY-like chemotaxis protein
MSKNRRILVIDDSEVMLERVKRTLTDQGFEVVATSQIVGNARQLPSCDLVIVDYHMPGLDGSTVVASMRAVGAMSTRDLCPIYLYTSDAAVMSQYTELGFDGVFTAKGNEEALVRQVQTLFRLLDIRRARADRLNKEGVRDAQSPPENASSAPARAPSAPPPRPPSIPSPHTPTVPPARSASGSPVSRPATLRPRS